MATLWALSRNSGNRAVGQMVAGGCHEMQPMLSLCPSFVFHDPLCMVFFLSVLFEVVSGQWGHSSSWDRLLLDVAGDKGHTGVVVWEVADSLGACIPRSFNGDNTLIHSFTSERGVLKEEDSSTMKDSFAVVALGLWSMLSMAAVVNTATHLQQQLLLLLLLLLLPGTNPVIVIYIHHWLPFGTLLLN